MKRIIILITFTIGLLSCNLTQNNNLNVVNNDSLNIHEQNAKVLLKFGITDSSNYSYFIDKTVFVNLRDKETVIRAVEPILFNIYGKVNIIKQRPYRLTYLDNYWNVEGTFPEEMAFGGAFHLILDSRSGEVIYIIHGK